MITEESSFNVEFSIQEAEGIYRHLPYNTVIYCANGSNPKVDLFVKENESLITNLIRKSNSKGLFPVSFGYFDSNSVMSDWDGLYAAMVPYNTDSNTKLIAHSTCTIDNIEDFLAWLTQFFSLYQSSQERILDGFTVQREKSYLTSCVPANVLFVVLHDLLSHSDAYWIDYEQKQIEEYLNPIEKKYPDGRIIRRVTQNDISNTPKTPQFFSAFVLGRGESRLVVPNSRSERKKMLIQLEGKQDVSSLKEFAAMLMEVADKKKLIFEKEELERQELTYYIRENYKYQGSNRVFKQLFPLLEIADQPNMTKQIVDAVYAMIYDPDKNIKGSLKPSNKQDKKDGVVYGKSFVKALNSACKKSKLSEGNFVRMMNERLSR